jgi:hypothetical protein
MVLSKVFHGTVPEVNDFFLPTGTSFDNLLLARPPRLARLVTGHVGFAGFT